MSKISFSTCCFVKSVRSRRASIVKESIGTWTGLLKYEFKKKYFVDDRSENFSGLKILEQSNVAGKFDQVHFFPFTHAPHSNFGIVYSIEIASSPYILHLDDDVIIKSSESEISEYIDKCIKILDEDKKILGINILTLDAEMAQWLPENRYEQDICGDFSHPRQFFGTCACIVRRDLLKLVSFDQIVSHGSNQPMHWERMVSRNTDNFLVSNIATPFVAHPEAWATNATSRSKIKKIANKLRRIGQN